jgi:uncharacterized protein YjbI with pentapeptide repeats
MELCPSLKYIDKASEYHWSTYHLGEEKRILRKLAALRQMHDRLTKSMVIRGLENYGISYDEARLKDMLDPILTSYFYLQSTALDISMDFIHKSFREYFLAEYYLESILNDRVHYLNVGIPSPETVSFLDGLLELLLENQNEILKEHANIITKSLLSQTHQQDNRSLSDMIQILWKNAQRYYEEELIIFETERYESNKKWLIADFPISKYAELWIHRWLSLYVLNKLAPDIPIDKKMLADFIVKTSHTVPQLQMRLNKVDLSDQFLGNAMLSGANLSGANLSDTKLVGADLSYANLSDTDLSHAYLSGADLSDAKIVGANLYDAKLSDADLSFANLSSANLSNAKIFDANLSFANLSGADLSQAYLTFADISNADLPDSNLTGANLTGADLSNADLSGADLSGADLSKADLSSANLSGADLSDVKIDNRSNFENAKLTSAYPSSIVTDIRTRTIGKESNAKSSSVDTKPSIHRITKYTSDGKPVN